LQGKVRNRNTSRKRQAEAGIALLISIFVLLLISVIAIALVVSSGTESALAGNYRASTGVYYAALSGLEEARGRLFAKNPDAFKTTDSSTFLPGTDLIMGKTYYLINPIGGEPITPWDSTSTYPDTQFAVEFGPSGFTTPTNPSLTALSVWNRNPLQSLNLPGPLYKWVRINAVSEKSLGVDADADGLANKTTPLYYTGTNFSNNPLAGSQVLELTSFAILPNGSQKLVQYLVAPAPVTLPPFLAALTLSGSTANPAAYHAPASNTSYAIKGKDYDCDGTTLTALPSYPAVGVFTNTDQNTVINGIPSSPASVRASYTGVNNPGPYIPDVENLNLTSPSFPASLQTPSQIDALAQTIAQSADKTLPSGPITYPLPTVTGTSLTPLGMSATNPLTVVINGNLDISNWSNDGFGLLLVLGKFTYDPDTTWDGIILVIGQGQVDGSHMQNKQINGAMFVAKTRNSSGALLPDPNLGGASVQFSDSMQGYGIRYSNCWIQKVQPTGSYKILSFHEISQ
jgi:hypothetical protein